MCGIIGIFGNPNAGEMACKGLQVISYRGKDGAGIATQKKVHYANTIQELPSLQTTEVIGHILHAVVEQVAQPLRGEGTLTANCEIYNWKSLAKQYQLKVRNDAEFLLQFLDRFGTTKIAELDGVFAFAYWRGNKVILMRDLIGEKPLWYVHTRDQFAFASEKKTLENIGYEDIQELNPRWILEYDLGTRQILIEKKFFLDSTPEHKENYEELKAKTKILLESAIEKRVPQQKFGVLFSGGVDSTYIANNLKKKGYEFTCYTAAVEGNTPATDLLYATKAAKEIGLNLKIKTVAPEGIPPLLKKIVPLIEDSNVVKVGVALPFYLACELAKEDGCKVIFSGLGSEEIFAGYERHKHALDVNKECISGLLKMYERDLYRDDVVTMNKNVELRLPFLDLELVRFALCIPARYKLVGDKTKTILRDIALESGVPTEIALRKKTAAQYGSRFDDALSKLAKKNLFSSKSAYLRTFYLTHNLRLGVLFSGGKDSTYAAYIMRQQNYDLTCLITIRSDNPASYMFQSAGVELVHLQAEAMNLPLVVEKTSGEKEKELEDLKVAIKKAKEEYNLQGIVTGAVASTYQRDRIEQIAEELGLKIFSPLWHKEPEQEMKELLEKEFEFILTAIAGEGLNKNWLNKLVTMKEVEQLKKLHQKYGLSVNGEGGEFESVVLDCPLFLKKIIVDKAVVKEEKKECAYIYIQKAHLSEK